MSYTISSFPKLFAFDLDGTLLNSQKKLSAENISALTQIFNAGSVIAFASGRIKSSIDQYITECPFPIAVLSLNGAAVFMDDRFDSKLIYQSHLPSGFAKILIDDATEKNIALNFYHNDALYSVDNEFTRKWIDLYIQQTSSSYQMIPSFDSLMGISPSKIIMVGPPKLLDEQQAYFSSMWNDSVYICRTWDYYLEFLNPEANKGLGIKALCDAYGIDIQNAITFGDAENDIPMLQAAGMSIAVNNSSEKVKSAAKYVSDWNNDEHVIAQEWENLKNFL